MKIDIPKIVEELRLSDYAPEFGEAAVYVWVNPPRALREEYTGAIEQAVEALKEVEAAVQDQTPEGQEKLKAIRASIRTSEQRQRAWFAEIWSQGPEETRWTVEEIDQLAQSATDPALLPWLTRQTVQTIGEHRAASKKASTPRSGRSPSAA